MSDLMKRAAPGMALAGLALSTVWLFDPALHAAGQPSAAAADESASTAPADSAPADSAVPDSGVPDSGAGDSGATDPGATSGGCSSAEAATGKAVMTQWGPVQVQAQLAADGTLCSVQAITYPANDPHSSRINAMAIPYLDQQASSVGVAFDSVSGATYTSEAYRESLQSILDQQ